jgi:hypothetical protein
MDIYSPGYIILIVVALVFTIAFVIVMYSSQTVFMYLICIYLVAFCVYMTIFLSKIKSKVPNDNYFILTAYINLYNIFLFAGLFVMYIIFHFVKYDGKTAIKQTKPRNAWNSNGNW